MKRVLSEGHFFPYYLKKKVKHTNTSLNDL